MGICDAGSTNQIPPYDVDTAYFADASTGWLAIRTADHKLTLLHTTDGGAAWKPKELPGERAEALHFVDDKKGFAFLSAGPSLKPSISHHLSALKNAKLILDERDGQNIVYSLNTTVIHEVMGWFLEMITDKVEEEETKNEK